MRGEDFRVGSKETLSKWCFPMVHTPNLKKREGVPEMGTKPLGALSGYRASNRGSKGSRKTPEALRG